MDTNQDRVSPSTLSSSDGVAYVDGAYVPVGEAKLPILDWGFTSSDVTYDVVHVWKGAFFRLDDHLDRFERSCKALRLKPPYSRAEMQDILTHCVASSGLREAYVEMVCTRGLPAPGSRDLRTCQNTFMAFAIPFIWIIPPEKQEQGVRMDISKIQRIPAASVDPTVKNFHWGDLTQALFVAYDNGADTVVLVDLQGNISEGPGFNVYCIKDGTITSPGGTVLEGITRQTIKELCSELGIPFAIATVTPDGLRSADEVFISSTAGGIMPIASIGDRVIGNGQPGPITSRLSERYWAKHDEGWHATPIDYE